MSKNTDSSIKLLILQSLTKKIHFDIDKTLNRVYNTATKKI